MTQNANRHYLKNDRRFFKKRLKMNKEIECHAAMYGCVIF